MEIYLKKKSNLIYVIVKAMIHKCDEKLFNKSQSDRFEWAKNVNENYRF